MPPPFAAAGAPFLARVHGYPWVSSGKVLVPRAQRGPQRGRGLPVVLPELASASCVCARGRRPGNTLVGVAAPAENSRCRRRRGAGGEERGRAKPETGWEQEWEKEAGERGGLYSRGSRKRECGVCACRPGWALGMSDTSTMEATPQWVNVPWAGFERKPRGFAGHGLSSQPGGQSECVGQHLSPCAGAVSHPPSRALGVVSIVTEGAGFNGLLEIKLMG